MMKRIAALAVFLVSLVGFASPAFARDAYVVDNAGLLSASTVSALNAKIGDFYAQTHKEVYVDTESTVIGDPKAAAEKIYAQQQVNGVMIYIAKEPKTIGVIPDRAAASYFPAGSTSAIRSAIASGFNAGNFDEGVTNGVDLTINMYRSHMGALRSTNAAVPAYTQPVRSDTGGGFHMGFIWWLIVLAVIFFIIRGIFRAMSGPRVMPPGYGGGPGYGGPGYGGYGPGYGGGPMGGGGGGSFFSGLLGGLGGAFLGNELFGNRGETIINPGQTAGFGGDPGSANYGGDQSGFQSDPGQADMGNSSFGGWGGGGDSGGGGGWGGGDSGGGGWGGGDSGGGGGGGDSGGGW
jgi:hypothetical protein